MQKLYLLRPTKSDAAQQRIRFLSGPSSTMTTWAMPWSVEDDLYQALPRVAAGNIGFAWPSVVRIGEYPPFAEVNRVISEFASTAKRCECGLYRQFGMQRCYGCTQNVLAAHKDKPTGYHHSGAHRTRAHRTRDHREDTYETKYGG